MKKRICAVIMCLLLAVNLVGVPKAKAVVSEGALLGSIFGSLLVSMGYSWAADNMDVPGFGEALYKLTQEYDESNKDTGFQLIRDLNIAALTAGRPGTIQFNYAWVQAARSFAEWFQAKFFSNNNKATVYESNINFSVNDTAGIGTLNSLSDFTAKINSVLYGQGLLQFENIPITKAGVYTYKYTSSISDYPLYLYSVRFYNGSKSILDDTGTKYEAQPSSDPTSFTITQTQIDSGVTMSLQLQSSITSFKSGTVYPLTKRGLLTADYSSSLSVEKPQEVHYPEVADDGSQVYEITVDGVTATDIEGIIQGAVDQILAGTAAIAGEVAQAQDVPVTPEAPAAGEYAVPGLESIFPFCIPFDIYAFCSALNAEPVAPSFEWRMQYAPLGLDYTFEIDLSDFDGVAQVLRTMELLAFCVGLAFWTRHLIRG